MDNSKFHAPSRLKKFRKQIFIVGGLTFIALLVLAFFSDQKEEVAKPKRAASETFTAVRPSAVQPAEIVSQRFEQAILEQQKLNQQTAKKLTELESENLAYKAAAEQRESDAAAMNDKLATLNTIKASSSAPAVAVKPQKIVFEDDINSDGSDADGGFEDSAKSTAAATKNDPSGQSTNDANSKDNKNPDKVISTYIPSNSFAKGVLISSLSANTGGNASSDPTPILINLTDLAQLPNGFRSNIKSCLVGASGWGDLSTERVKARLTTMSCVLKSGKAIDISVDGYIAGEDSKAGIKGVVISHSGSIAAKAGLAGLVQGIGAVGQAVGQTQTITPLGGVTTTVDPNQALTSGLGTGVSQAGSNLSQYYMNMLTQISPSIEVAARRHVTVIFTKGIELKLPINSDAEDNQQPLPIR